jgi:ATPase family associated with various cellular activities (AAA)
MQITIKGRVAKKLRSDVEAFQKMELVWNEDASEHEYRDVDLDLGKLTRAECEKLRDILRTSGIQGTRVLAADITKYLRAAQEGVEKMTARVVRQAAWMLEFFFAHLPHHMIFSKDEYEGGSYVGYYVEDVEYCERKEHSRGSVTPEHVVVDLLWIDKDTRRSQRLNWYAEDVLGMTPTQMLQGQGYVVETPALMERFRVETELYYEVRDEVGKKYTARGLAKDDLDDAAERSTEHMYGWSRSHKSKVLRMDLFGVETPVVVDILSEKGDKEESRSDGSVNLYRWHPWNMRFHSPSDDDLARHLEADEDTDFTPELQLPVHPLVPCFDLKRHARLRVHVNNLTEYVYRPEVARRLVIPKRDRALIDLLVEQSSNNFQDVVEGKGQSMNILSGGIPGTGKTLTAEVFAEFKSRPLYNVQCSQLGLNPEQVEQNLGVVLQRANRWNAILLLDEADVYIRRRGDDLAHNAIVGVFLRVLEYAQCILFMTTNLANDVDDAIASRCIVKIGYDVPGADDQCKIWRTLADLNRIDLPDDTIAAFVAAHPRISGRDVKNLLKLASFVSARDGRSVDLQTLEFALEYKPTAAV